MTLLKLESFDWLETADLSTAYGAFSVVQPVGTMTATIQETGGRNGAKCLRIIPGTGADSGNTYNMQGRSFGTGVAGGGTVIVGFAVKFNTLQESGNLVFAGIESDAGTGDNRYNVVLALNASYNLVAGHSISGTVSSYGAASATVFTAGMWYYVELKFVSHGSTGAVTVRINGVQEIALTNLDTLKLDNGVGSLVLGANIPQTTLPSVDFDDIYIADTNGSVNNNFLGDRQVALLTPTANGNSSQFVGSDADSTDNYLLVDDGAAPDDDTTYVESSTNGNKDTYGFSNLPSYASEVLGVGVKIIAKKVDPGARDAKAVARSSTTETDSAALGFSDSYTARQGIFEQDPNTTTTWTVSGVNAAEFGLKAVT